LYDDKCDAVDVTSYSGGKVVQPYIEDAKAIGMYWDTGDIILGPEYPYSFRIHFDTRLNDIIVLDWVRQNRPDLKKIEIIQLDLAQYHGVVPVEKEIWKAWGLDVHYTWYDFSTKDFYPVLTAALKDKPDAVCITQSAGNSMIKQARELGFKGQFILPESVAFFWNDVLSAEDMEGLICMAPNLDSPEVPQAYKDYLVRYEEHEDRLPYSSKVFTEYTWVYLMAAAIKAAGSTDADKLKEVMETQPLTLEFPGGVTMTIDFFGREFYGVDHNWQPNQHVSIMHNGEAELQEVLSPLDQMKYVELIQGYEGQAGEYNPEEDTVIGPGEETGGCPDRALTVDDTIGTLMDCPDTRAILEEHVGQYIDERTPMFLTVRSWFTLAGPDRMDQSKLPLIIEDLEALYGE